jgi:uncharacterized membrane-anchored protein
MPTRLSETKIPEITVLFWVMKIAATTLGETGGDLLAQTMKIGYAVSTLILLGVMLGTLVGQLRLRSFSPALYWTVIATTSMAGTTISDYIDRTLGWGYYKGSVVLVVLLVSALWFWKAKFGSLSISRVDRFAVELMFWTTVLIANTLGTALGDWLSDNTGLGFGRATLVLTALLAFTALLHFRTEVNKVVLFWAGFVLIQPFGATAGDLWTKSPAIGGMGFPTYYASAVLAAILVALILLTDRNGALTVSARASRSRPARRRTVTAPATDVYEQVSREVSAVLKAAAESAERIETEAQVMAERCRRQAEAEASELRRAALAEAAALRAQVEREATEMIEQAKATAAQRALLTERQIDDLRATGTAVLERLQQAEVVWQGVLDLLSLESLAEASLGNGAY